ncbi:MAG: DUF815 domain-containing protein [Clostridia bacterium]|nr:DUF815 domain-containing protein [Clostridia bacterium]
MHEQVTRSASESLNGLSSRLCRLTLLRRLLEEGPLAELCRLITALYEGDVMLAQDRYHAFAAELLSGGYRRVSGDLFCDFLLSELLEKKNGFSAMAARGEKDLPTMNAMRAELSILCALSKVTSSRLRDWIMERGRENRSRPRPQQDNIALMSNAAWTGGSRTSQREFAPQPPAHLPAALFEGEWLSWEYEAEQEFGDYVSDEALEEIYHRLLHSEDWRDCLEDLWNFHASYGTGSFLRHRMFALSGGKLLPLPGAGLAQGEPLFHEEEHAALMREVIRFMQGEASERILVTGGAGTGKTMSVISLAKELPEVRLVLTGGEGVHEIADLCETLRQQPLRFLLLIDDVDLSSAEFAKLRSGFAGGGIGGANILCIVTAREGDDSLFTRRLELRAPTFKEFVELVQRLLSLDGLYFDYDEVQDACIDHKAAVKGELSFTAAVRVAQNLRRTREA